MKSAVPILLLVLAAADDDVKCPIKESQTCDEALDSLPANCDPWETCTGSSPLYRPLCGGTGDYKYCIVQCETLNYIGATGGASGCWVHPCPQGTKWCDSTCDCQHDWVTCPPLPPPPTPAPPPPLPDPKVVTLGDSYSSGTGIWRRGRDYDQEYGGWENGYKLTVRDDSECWREKQSTPGPIIASTLGRSSVFLACKGAEVSHVKNQVDLLNSKYPADAYHKWKDSVIVLTGGGNDIRTKRGEDWPELLTRCIIELVPFTGCHQNSKNQVNNWSTIQNRLVSLYSKLATSASEATVRVLGYPLVMQRDPGCSSVTGVSRNEADWMDAQVNTLNSKIVAAVNQVKSANSGFDIQYVSVVNYITIGACGPKSTRQVNDKVLAGLSTSDSSFHPTIYGYQQYLVALANSLPP